MKKHYMTELHDFMNPEKLRKQVATLLTEDEAKTFDTSVCRHPAEYLDWLHEQPEDFKKILPELNDIMEEIKHDTTKVTVKRNVTHNSPTWAIISVLADKYDTTLSKVGRGLFIYTIRHAKKGVD